MKNILTIDYEEWFHGYGLDGCPDPRRGKRLPQLTHKILDILDRNQTKATFFVLGQIAEEMPHLIKEIAFRGHEIGCHGYEHRPLNEVDPSQLRGPILKAKEILEDLTGKKVRGFRAPWFALPTNRDQFFQMIKQAGFEYDSSIWMAWGPGKDSLRQRTLFRCPGGLFEVAIPFLLLWARQISLCSGILFRLLPSSITNWYIKQLNEHLLPAVLFLHPYEFDLSGPVLPSLTMKKLRRKICLYQTGIKLRKLTRLHSFCSAGAYLDGYLQTN